MKKPLLSLVLASALIPLLGTPVLRAQPAPTQVAQAQPDPLAGVWEGYDGEWGHVSRQLVALAEAIPSDKYAWRPGPGVRSTGEVFMHIAIANFFLLSATGDKEPDVPDSMEKSVTSKADIIDWLKRSLEAVKAARAQLKPGDLQKRVKIDGKVTNVDAMYLRIIIHDNEHMGQLVAYARMNGIVPPWSR
jgi:uncharacterized damage-inducible protein DinB